MIINGNISIDVEKKTVNIRLDNGSYCKDHFTTGAKHFLDEEIEHRSCKDSEKDYDPIVFEKWVAEREKELFRTENFRLIGKSDDYIFQALAFTGYGSQELSLATTVLSEQKEVPDELKNELKSIQNQIQDFQEKLRKIQKGGC